MVKRKDVLERNPIRLFFLAFFSGTDFFCTPAFEGPAPVTSDSIVRNVPASFPDDP